MARPRFGAADRGLQPLPARQVDAARNAQVDHVLGAESGKLLQQGVEVARHMQVGRQQMPVELADRQRRDLGLGARRGDLHQQRLAGVVGLEAIGFGRAGVPGAGVDALAAVPVAQRQVVETGAGGAVRRQRIGRVDAFGQDALHAAVAQADAQQAGRRLGLSNQAVRSL